MVARRSGDSLLPLLEMTMILRVALLTLPLIAGCQTTAATPVSVAAPADLEELLRDYSAQAGVNITYNEHTAALLSAIEIKRIGPAEASILLITGPSERR